MISLSQKPRQRAGHATKRNHEFDEDETHARSPLSEERRFRPEPDTIPAAAKQSVGHPPGDVADAITPWRSTE
jgi:hypothetical protein